VRGGGDQPTDNGVGFFALASGTVDFDTGGVDDEDHFHTTGPGDIDIYALSGDSPAKITLFGKHLNFGGLVPEIPLGSTAVIAFVLLVGSLFLRMRTAARP